LLKSKFYQSKLNLVQLAGGKISFFFFSILGLECIFRLEIDCSHHFIMSKR